MADQTKLDRKIGRRQLLAGMAAGAAVIAAPSIVRAQTRELVVGGAAGFAGYMRQWIFPVFEKKYNATILFEGTRSLVNLEKMRADKDKPKMSVVLMDDPVMLLAEAEGLLTPLTAAAIPNIAKIKPAAVQHDGAWANYQQPWSGVAFNTAAVKGGIASYAELWDPKYKGKVILPSLQNTEGLWTLIAAAQLATGKPLKEAQYEIEAGFAKMKALKPNLLTIYTNQPQAETLLEQGEAVLMGGQFSNYTLLRTAEGAPVDLCAPKEGVFAMPSGICKVKNGPQEELANAFINEFLGPELQAILVEKSFVLPTNPATAIPAGRSTPADAFVPDWGFIAKNRNAWVERWDREMA